MSFITIVGAGAAGLAAARELTSAGRRVVVLEARDRIGGRIFSLQHDKTELPIELGAEFLHGLPPELVQVLKFACIAPVEVPDVQLYLDSNRKLIDTERFNNALEEVMEALPQPGQGADQNFAQWLEDTHFSQPAIRIATAYVEGFNAADSKKISVHALVKSAEAAQRIDGDRQFRLTRPYSLVPRTLLNSCDQNLIELHMNAEVSEIEWSKDKVTCRLKNGSEINSQQVVITLPLPLLQHEVVKFTPPLLSKRACLDKLVMGHTQRVVFVCKSFFWDSLSVDGKSLRQLNFIDDDEGPFRTWWTSYPLRVPILVGWNSGPDVISGVSSRELSSIAIARLAEIFGVSVEIIENEVESVHYHDWSEDEYSRGAYSYSIASGAEAPRELAQPIDGTLFFAGEATDYEGNSGYVHGAIASGIRAARQILEL